MVVEGGTISVNGYSETGCKGTNQGGTKVGVSGKCANFSNAKSLNFHDSDSKHCDTIHFQYYAGFNCGGNKAGEYEYTAGNCVNINDINTHTSAFMKCVNT